LTTTSTVIDASALLAYLQDEPGGSKVGDCLDGALLSTVNLCEVIQKAIQFGVDTTGLAADLAELGVCLEPFTPDHAEIAAALWPTTRSIGLSLADRACLALAIDNEARVLTTDRVWSELDIKLAIEVIR